MGYIETLGEQDSAIADFFETLGPPENIHILPLAILLSLVINAGLLFLWQSFRPAIPEIGTAGDLLEVRLQSVDLVPVPPEKEPVSPKQDARRNISTEPAEAVVEAPPADKRNVQTLSSTASPAGKTTVSSKDWKRLLSAPMVAEFMRSRDFSSPPNQLSQNPGTEFEDVFRSDLRQTLREQAGRIVPAPTNDLNNSTISDAHERVAIAGECFDLKNIAGGRIGQKLWYPRECNGKTDLSETMAQAIRDRMNRTNLRE